MHDPSQNQDQTNENLTEPFLPAIAALYRTMSVGPTFTAKNYNKESVLMDCEIVY